MSFAATAAAAAGGGSVFGGRGGGSAAASTGGGGGGQQGGVRISGATGEYGQVINGVFEQSDELSGGLPLYKKKGGFFLEFVTSRRRWIIKRGSDLGQSNTTGYGYCECPSSTLPHLMPAGGWQVAYTLQPSIVVVPMSAQEVAEEAAAATAALQAAAAAARAGATYALRISGATGPNAAYVNGLYEVTDEISGGFPVYRREGGQYWLEMFASTTRWCVKRTSDKGQECQACFAYATSPECALPDLVTTGTWHVAVGQNYVHAPGMVVIRQSAAQIAEVVAAMQASLAAARAAATYAVRISGASGDAASLVNGRYTVTEDISGGMPIYRKDGGSSTVMYLEYYASTQRWLCRSTQSLGQSNEAAYAYVDCAPGKLPDQAPEGTWQVAVSQVYGLQSAVKLTTNKT